MDSSGILFGLKLVLNRIYKVPAAQGLIIHVQFDPCAARTIYIQFDTKSQTK